jgi:hypothetical protein
MNGVYVVVVTTITPNGSATLPFVIPSAVEGSAVQSFGCNEFVIPTGANPEIRVSAVERLSGLSRVREWVGCGKDVD